MDSLTYCNFTPTNYMGEPEQGKSGLDDNVNEVLARLVRALIIISADSISNAFKYISRIYSEFQS